MNRSPNLSLQAQGTIACFTRPELKVERVSYPVMTPSAARGILESVIWKPAIDWHIIRIQVLKPIEFVSFRRNEVNSKAVSPPKTVVTSGGPAPSLIIEDDRAQRNTVALRDVDYLVEAYFTMTEQAGDADNLNKFVDMFSRRVEKGQRHTQPYFGCREFAASVLPVDGAPSPIDESRDLGIMLWDIDFQEDGNCPIFFHARLESGVLRVPPLSETMRGAV